MKILLIDNFDSFTYNLLHLLEENPQVQVTVFRNNQLSQINLNLYDKVVISPGPGLPHEAGQLSTFLTNCLPVKPTLGVCLGHQAIVTHYGGNLTNLSSVKHGVSTAITQSNKSLLFKNLPHEFEVGRYHSWVADRSTFPTCLQVTATDAENCIMAFEHTHLPVYGIQFHPESVLTPLGRSILTNWLNA